MERGRYGKRGEDVGKIVGEDRGRQGEDRGK